MMIHFLCITAVLLLHSAQGWVPIPPLRATTHITRTSLVSLQMSITSTSINAQRSLVDTETRIRQSDAIAPSVSELLQLIPPSSFYKSDQLKDAYATMVGLLEGGEAFQQQDVYDDVITYYLQTLHTACHEILGHVHISLAKDVYDKLLPLKHPLWCRLMFEIANTNPEVADEELAVFIQEWVDCSDEALELVKEYLLQTHRMDLWGELTIKPPVSQEDSPPKNGVEGEAVNGFGASLSASETTLDSADGMILPTDVDARESFHLCVGELESTMQQDRINATQFYSTVYLTLETLKELSDATEDELRAGLWIASSCLLRRDVTWIFRLLDQRGLIQRDDVYQILHVYCNDHRRPFGIHFSLSMLGYLEQQSSKNAYIRRPDPIMYRMVLKAIGINAAHGFGHRALQVMKCMSQRERGEDADKSWQPVFEDHAAAVAAFVDDSQAWQSVRRADGLVRSLYSSPVGMRESTPTSPRLEQLMRVGQKLRIVPLVPLNSPGPLYKVLKAHKDSSESSSDDNVVHAFSLFEFAVEQTAAGNRTLEEVSKYHFFLVMERCKRTNPFLAQECVRLFTRIDQLVGYGLLSQDLVSPSVSYQMLALLAADKCPGHSTSAETILEHYISRTKDPRLAAFQYAIQCCCAENSPIGCTKAVALLERTARTFRRKPFRDSFFLDTLRQIELHDPKLASRVYAVVTVKLYTNPLDVDTRIAVLMSLYRSLRKDQESTTNMESVVTKLSKLRDSNPSHPAFASGEFLEAMSGDAPQAEAAGQTASAIDILLSSKEAGDIAMAESILEQGEADGTPHGIQTYEHVIEAFIGNNDMSAATSVLRRMKIYHPKECQNLESDVFDILLSGQPSDLQLAESMLSWTNDPADLANMCTKMIYTCLSIGPSGYDIAKRVLSGVKGKLGEDDVVWAELNEVVTQTGQAPL
jgi:hypothetical protein